MDGPIGVCLASCRRLAGMSRIRGNCHPLAAKRLRERRDPVAPRTRYFLGERAPPGVILGPCRRHASSMTPRTSQNLLRQALAAAASTDFQLNALSRGSSGRARGDRRQLSKIASVRLAGSCPARGQSLVSLSTETSNAETVDRICPRPALVIGALAIGAATVPAQALPAQGLSVVPTDAARATTLLEKAGWRWRRVGYHRYWWRRWRRW